MTILEFYDKLPKIDVGSPYTKIVKDYKIFNIEKHYKMFEELEIKEKDGEEGDKLKKYLLRFNDDYILIPLRNLDEEIYGFVMRTNKEKHFHNHLLNHNYPLIFGLYDFVDYELGKPILLTEGIKDVLTLKEVYKYSLAYLTSVPSEKMMQWLTQITNKLIWFPDNDVTGRSLKFTPSYYCPYSKDLGDYWSNKDPKYIEFVRIILKKEKVINE